jgi:hypothetical protein
MLLNICSGYERMRCSRIKQHNCRSVVDEKHTNDHIWNFLGFLHSNMVDSSMSIVLLASNRNRVGSTSGGRHSSSILISMDTRIGASVGIMSLVSIVVASMICLQWVLGNLGPLNSLISGDKSLKIVGALNHMTLRGGKSLSSCLQPWLKLWLSRAGHKSG